MDYPPLTVEVKVLDPRLRDWGLPRYQSAMAAGIDLYACPDAPMTIPPGAPAVLVPSGMAIHIADPSVTAVIVPRSGLGHRKGLVLGNLTGVVDADYTGQVFISVWNRSSPDTQPIVIAPGERIAQMLFVPVLRPCFTVVQEFSATTRRSGGGFGSTGVGMTIKTADTDRVDERE
ncbi:dUTP diphosphatase [Paracoccus spongiarum]|uniref:dUTP diphosphatase n=1 Tax=Paracoccus spongiarum TaxID=3064387 RepID=A0ABT9J9I7_9RHOB|nr:dUTP diphosphatase [Paracoccus sp. 2205BS29-5]MDP5305822.1 dUTP diphosphatase [Paracoccus sp. 2205BS29-5]